MGGVGGVQAGRVGVLPLLLTWPEPGSPLETAGWEGAAVGGAAALWGGVPCVLLATGPLPATGWGGREKGVWRVAPPEALWGGCCCCCGASDAADECSWTLG